MRCFVSDLVLSPWEVGTAKAELLVHEKATKNLLSLFLVRHYVAIFMVQESDVVLSTRMSDLEQGGVCAQFDDRV